MDAGNAGGGGVGPGSLEVSWITLMVQFILMTANFSHEGSPRMAGPEVSATYQQEFSCELCTRGARLPGDKPMK